MRTAWGKRGVPMAQVHTFGTVVLGKMLTSSPTSVEDSLLPYLRAANVQPDGALKLDDMNEMWFRPAEVRSLTLDAGDVVVVEGGQGGFGRAAHVPRDLPGVGFQNSINRVRPHRDADGRFITYALLSARSTGYLHAYCDAVSMPHLTSEKLARLPIPWHPHQAQRAIADFLDRETAKIDALVEKQNEMVDLLRLRRQETVWAVVTRGIADSDMVPVRTSPWVSELPKGWSVSRIHYDFEVVLGKMLDAGRQAFDNDTETPYVRAANIQDWGLDLADVNTMPFRPIELERLSLERGDLLVVEGGSVGTVHYLDQDMPGWSFQKTVNRVRSRGSASTRFLAYVIRGLRDRGVISLICDGSTIAHLTAEKLRALRVPKPPYEIQEGLADYLDRETARIDALIDKAEQFVELAKERRAALITAAVTGQLDVSGKGDFDGASADDPDLLAVG